jgi:hypothetical protein
MAVVKVELMMRGSGVGISSKQHHLYYLNSHLSSDP